MPATTRARKASWKNTPRICGGHRSRSSAAKSMQVPHSRSVPQIGGDYCFFNEGLKLLVLTSISKNLCIATVNSIIFLSQLAWKPFPPAL